MKMDIQIQRAAKTLYKSHGPALAVRRVSPDFFIKWPEITRVIIANAFPMTSGNCANNQRKGYGTLKTHCR